MKLGLVRLVVRFALRNGARATITSLGVGVTLLAFLLLRTLIANWYTVNEELAHSDQLEVRHKISIAFMLYRRMAEKIRALPGVEEVSGLIWFSGYYKTEKERFGQLAVEGEPYFKIHPEYAPPAVQLQSYMEDMSGAIIGPELATKYGWKIGDRITLKGTMFPGDWDFTVRGVYSADAPEGSRLYMHYKRLNVRNEQVHRLVVKADPSAIKRIDELFANSETPTKTESELMIQRSYASWSAGVIAAMDVAAVLVLVILVLVLGNGMALAAREGKHDYATLRAIGYNTRHILLLVMAEGMLIGSFGIALALLVTPSALKGMSRVIEERLGGSWELHVDGRVVLFAAGAALVASMAATGLPAWQSARLRVVDALRRVA